VGCDIHLYVEVKRGKKWEVAYAPESMRPEYDPTGIASWYRGRNYDMFAVLADVRNGSGFDPIVEPRGVPGDCSKEVKAIVKEWSSDGHSHSWLTVRELLDYDWQGPTATHQGWVDTDEYGVFKEKGKPNSWSGGVGGIAVKHLSNEDMDKAITEGTADSHCYTLVERVESYATSAGDFLRRTLPELEKLGKAENVRIVCFFDN